VPTWATVSARNQPPRSTQPGHSAEGRCNEHSDFLDFRVLSWCRALCGLRHQAPCRLQIESIDWLRFLHGCRKMRLCLSSLLAYRSECVLCCSVRPLSVLRSVSSCSLSCLIWLGCQLVPVEVTWLETLDSEMTYNMCWWWR